MQAAPESGDPQKLLAGAVRSLQPALEKRRRRFMRGLVLGAVGIVLAVSALVLHNRDSLDQPALAVIFAALVPSVILYQVLGHLYRAGNKKRLMEGLAAGAGLAFNAAGVFSLDGAAQKHLIIPFFDRGHAEDGFGGTYRDMPFAVQEISLSQVRHDPRHRGRRREMAVFTGLLIRLTLPRRLEAHTVVIPQNVMRAYFADRFSDFQRVRLVSPKFEKQFDALGTDQVEARVILNPAFMERFVEAGEILGAKWMDVSFCGNEILFVVRRGRPLFESGPLWQAVTAENLGKCIAELESVFRLIDVLKLNRQMSAA